VHNSLFCEAVFGCGLTLKQIRPCYYLPHAQPTAACSPFEDSGFTDFCLRTDMQAHISRLSPAFMKISRGRLFQFALPGVLLPFSHASPAFAPLFKFANRHGQRTPAEPVPLKADPAPAYPVCL